MKLKIATIVLAAVMLPALAYAQSCPGSKHRTQQTSSCVEGLIWDTSKGACVPLINS